MAGCADIGYAGTRPVQSAVIPLALEGHDVVACAETGTGKTLAFVAPILQRLLTEQPHYGDPAREPFTRALILAPTRELAAQIEDTIVGSHLPLARARPCRSTAASRWARRSARSRPASTSSSPRPGRLMDHMRHGAGDFLRVQTLVLDEADRMLDMGFWPDVQRILRALPKDRQTLLFSATMPSEIVRLATEMQREPALRADRASAAPARTIRHALEEVRDPRQGRPAGEVHPPGRDRPGAGLRAHQDRRR